MTDDEVIAFLAGSGGHGGHRWAGLLSAAAELGPEVIRADIDITGHEEDRRLAAWEIVAPHLAAGAATWQAALQALSADERAEIERLITTTIPIDQPMQRPLSPQEGRDLESLAGYMHVFEAFQRQLPPVLDLLEMEPAARSEAMRDAVTWAIDEVADPKDAVLTGEDRERFRTHLLAFIDQMEQEQEQEQERGTEYG